MKATTSMATYRLQRAIAQAIGEMQNIGHAVWCTDVAQFLGVTKQTARKQLDRMVKDRVLTVHYRSYKADIPVCVYELTNKGWMYHNSAIAKEAKNAVLAMRGILI